MSLNSFSARLRSLLVGSGSAADEGIDEELTFHLRALVDENLAKGMSNDEAWQQATDRFGSLRRYAAECRRVGQPGHFVLPVLAGVVLVALAVASGALLVEVRWLRHENALLAESQQPRSVSTSCRVSATRRCSPLSAHRGRQSGPPGRSIGGDRNKRSDRSEWPRSRSRGRADCGCARLGDTEDVAEGTLSARGFFHHYERRGELSFR